MVWFFTMAKYASTLPRRPRLRRSPTDCCIRSRTSMTRFLPSMRTLCSTCTWRCQGMELSLWGVKGHQPCGPTFKFSAKLRKQTIKTKLCRAFQSFSDTCSHSDSHCTDTLWWLGSQPIRNKPRSTWCSTSPATSCWVKCLKDRA